MTPSTMGEPIIKLHEVAKTYAGRVPVHALHATDFYINRGESVAIVGASGSGKSTLLNILGLLDVPSAGTYRLDGVDITAAPDAVRGSIRGQKFGFVFQAFHLLPHRTVTENVELAMMYAQVSATERRQRAFKALETLNMMHRRDADPRELSGGERQRTAIARAVCLNPEVLFCDEPTGNLDSRNTDAVMETLARLNEQGQTLVMVTHDLGVAKSLHRMVSVKDGSIIPTKPPIAAEEEYA